MEQFNSKRKSRFTNLLEFIRDYRINILATKRLSGVSDMLIGWGLIATNAVFFSPPIDLILSEISFVIFFLAGCIAILLYSLYFFSLKKRIMDGFKYLLINKNIETNNNAIHLTVIQRVRWIYFRGFIATGGYIAYNISKIYFGVIDNSSIFGADALVYAILAFVFLDEKFNLKEWAGIIIASLGVFFILFFDISTFSWKEGLIGGLAGIISATALTIILFTTGIIVRHDNPLRVAFHQCAAGLMLSLVVLFFTVIFQPGMYNLIISKVSVELVKNSCVSGIIYAVALFFFLRAFLRVEPIVIAILGYSLGVFVVLFEWLFEGKLITAKDGISVILIGYGCALLIRQEYAKEKRKLKQIKTQKPIYEIGLKDELASLKEKFILGNIDKYTYLTEKNEFNKLLFEFSSEIKNSQIKYIKILPDAVLFGFNSPLNVDLETDRGARAAPFEVLNFGNYEAEDESMAYKLVDNGDTILDIGAHIGWYTVNFAKRYPKSKIYAFEPIKMTFKVLERNIKRNKINNVELYNFGFSNKVEEKILYYFPGGSALASIENLINHENNLKKITCSLTTVDNVVHNLKIDRLNFIKCDAEGSEYFILQGCKNTIKEFVPIIFTELYEGWCQKCGYSTEDVVKMLEEYGYLTFQAIKDKLINVDGYVLKNDEKYNYFFLNKKHHSEIIQKFVNKN